VQFGRPPVPENGIASPSTKLRLFLVDDNRLFREGLAGMLSAQHDLTVVAALADGEEAVRRVPATKPDVILLDLGLRNGNALELARTVRQASPETKVIVMGLLPIQEDVVEYVRAGVSGFVLKAATLDELLRAIRLVAQGGNVLPPPLTISLFSQIADLAAREDKDHALTAVQLTKREREVVDLIAAGMSNKEIAHQLHVATHTIRSHVHNALEKLELRSRLQIAAYMHTQYPHRAGPEHVSPHQ
jgi:DNA-binding NarL/FixJ family response regulator